MQQQHSTTTTTTTDYCNYQSPITATCVRVCEEFVCLCASCSDYSIVGVLVLLGGGGGCSSWMLLLNPLPTCTELGLTFAPSVLTFAPCFLTFAPCACGVILLSTSASTPFTHMVMVTGCTLCWWHYSFSHWHTYSNCAWATCTVWWWSVMV